MATWARRLSSAQAKQPGTGPRSAHLPDTLPEDIFPDDKTALRSMAALAREREGFSTRVPVRVGSTASFEDLVIEVFHTDDGPGFAVVGDEAPRDEPVPAPVDPPVDAVVEDDGGPMLDGDRLLEMMTDTLVVTSDIVAIFASVGAEALWANDAFVAAVPIREADKIWLIELLDEWSKGHFEVNVLPALVQHGRWHGKLVLQPGGGADELTVLASLVSHRDASGEIEAVSMVARDLRQFRESERRMAEGSNPLAALVEDAGDIIVVVDGSGSVLFASQAMTRTLGLGDGELDGTSLLDRVHVDDRHLSDFRKLAEPDEDGVPPSVELRLESSNGSWRIVELVAADLTDNPVIAGVVLTARDVTDRVQAVRRLADRAYTDPLTLLPNRMRLLDRLGKALGEADGRSVVAMLFDLDGFKGFNEQHGHAVGDELLRQVAHRLNGEVRPHDVVARLSGDEFAMVMRDVTDIDGALVAADRIKSRLGEPYRIGPQEFVITASVGIAVTADDQNAEQLLGDADTAVGIAKEHGGDRIEVMTAELRNTTSRRRSIESLLRRAITEGDGVEVHYQPVVDLETGRIVAAEALLRVHDDEGALLSPASFLEAAEDTGLISPLGGQVLEMTCRQLATWNKEIAPNTPQQISVNVSPRQLSDPHFPATVAEAIEAAGIEPAKLCLEITESILIGDKGIIDDTVAAVREMGVSIGLDDFGAGQSSLGYLKRFPLDFVKIDKELVQGLGTDEEGTAIVRATVDLAHSLGLQVIAVGVETEDQLEILQLLGVDRAQGFYYMAAVPAAELATKAAAELGD